MSEESPPFVSDSSRAIVTSKAQASESFTAEAIAWSSLAPTYLPSLPSSAIDSLLASTLLHLNLAQFRHLASQLPARPKRDFLADLPIEIALHILSFADSVKTLAWASRVSRTWRALVSDEALWKVMCLKRGFGVGDGAEHVSTQELWSSWDLCSENQLFPSPALQWFSYRKYFKTAHLTELNWRRSGPLLRSHHIQDAGVVTSVAIDNQWIVVGLSNSYVYVFSASTGVLARKLRGHGAGVWSVWLVSKGGGVNRTNGENRGPKPTTKSEPQENNPETSVNPPPVISSMGPSDPSSLVPSSNSSLQSDGIPFQTGLNSLPPYPDELRGTSVEDEELSFDQSDSCNTSRGWGQVNELVVSGGRDKQIRVWDVTTGHCFHVLRGHLSTVQCIKLFHGRPIAVSGSRDHTLRVWDIRKGALLRTLEGHTESVRCLDLCGNNVVSGSYDGTIRLWNVDTGECLRMFRGHYRQVYAVAFDGERIISGGLDPIVRVWSASTGALLALLQGHTSFVSQLQLSSRSNMVVTGGADGKIIVFSIPPADSYALANTVSRSPPVVTPSDIDEPTLVSLSTSMLAVDNSAGRDSGETRDASGYRMLTRVAAHSSNVLGLQFDDCPGQRRAISAGIEGRVKLWEFSDEFNPWSNDAGVCTQSDRDATRSWQGQMRLVRDLTEPCEGIWKVAFRGDVAVVCCLRSRRAIVEIWSFRPVDGDLY